MSGRFSFSNVEKNDPLFAFDCNGKQLTTMFLYMESDCIDKVLQQKRILMLKIYKKNLIIIHGVLHHKMQDTQFLGTDC